MKISQLPEPVRSRALELQRDANDKWDKETDVITDAFPCILEKEKGYYWNAWHDATKVTPELLKMHYKNAKEVRCLGDGVIYNIEELVKDTHLFYENIWVDTIDASVVLYDKEENQLAEIISYKEDPEVKEKSAGDTSSELYFLINLRKELTYRIDELSK